MAKSDIKSRTWRKTRERILRRDRQTCQYCGADANTVDHIIPRRLGGNDSDDNLLAACARCNYSKGGRFFEAKSRPPTPTDNSNRQNTSISHE